MKIIKKNKYITLNFIFLSILPIFTIKIKIENEKQFKSEFLESFSVNNVSNNGDYSVKPKIVPSSSIQNTRSDVYDNIRSNNEFKQTSTYSNNLVIPSIVSQHNVGIISQPILSQFSLPPVNNYCPCAKNIKCEPCNIFPTIDYFKPNLNACACAPKLNCQPCPPLSLLHEFASKKVFFNLNRLNKINEWLVT